MIKHFLKDTDFSATAVSELFSIARTLKANRGGHTPPVLAGQTWAMIFSKSSTRTRVSFEVGIRELGGSPLFLNKNDIQLGRSETIRDTARVLSRYIHGLIVRTYDHAEVEELALHGTVPVINALTDFLHPCQIYTDGFSLAEKWVGDGGGDLREALKGRKLVYFGDTANNMANSWLLGANLFGMEITLCGPENYRPGKEILDLLEKNGFGRDAFTFTSDPREAIQEADAVYTDVWVSMGKEEEAGERLEELQPYQVTAGLMAQAKPGALFLHCLPAYVGNEVTAEVIESPASIVFDQAENRLHAQKAILSVLGRKHG